MALIEDFWMNKPMHAMITMTTARINTCIESAFCPDFKLLLEFIIQSFPSHSFLIKLIIIPVYSQALVHNLSLLIWLLKIYLLHEPGQYLIRDPADYWPNEKNLDFLVFKNTCGEPCCQDNFNRHGFHKRYIYHGWFMVW